MAAAAVASGGPSFGPRLQMHGPSTPIVVRAQPGILHSALSSLVRLMLSRYTCGLDDDRSLLARLQQLPPRQAAALLARVPEKEVLQQLLMQVQDKVNRLAR